MFSACGQPLSNITSGKKKITRELKQDIASLIPSGTMTVDIMDEVTMSPRREELQRKFMLGVKMNREWFMEQQKLVETTGREITYDPKLGMSKPEWEDYKQLAENMSDMKAISSGKVQVTVIKENDVISFKSDGKLSHLNSVTIDLKNNVVMFANNTLNLVDTIHVASDDNVFKSAWRGYKWQFSNPENPVMPTSQTPLESFSMQLYGLTLGLFEKTGKTYMEISGSEVSNGVQTLRYKIPIVF